MKKISSIFTILLISFTMTATMIQDISFGEERVISAQETLNKVNIKSELKIEKTTIASKKLNYSKKESDSTKNKHEYISFDQIMMAIGGLICLLLITVVIINNS